MKSAEHSSLLLKSAPALFVAIWSTGWISARYGADYADPLTFLSLRFALAFLAMAAIAIFSQAPWPKGRAALHVMVSGVLLHALYLGGVWYAIAHGVPSGISGLIAAIQPILTAALAPILLRERIGFLQWLGIAAGFVGIAVALIGRNHPIGVCLAALLFGALYQGGSEYAAVRQARQNQQQTSRQLEDARRTAVQSAVQTDAARARLSNAMQEAFLRGVVVPYCVETHELPDVHTLQDRMTLTAVEAGRPEGGLFVGLAMGRGKRSLHG